MRPLRVPGAAGLVTPEMMKDRFSTGLCKSPSQMRSWAGVGLVLALGEGNTLKRRASMPCDCQEKRRTPTARQGHMAAFHRIIRSQGHIGNHWGRFGERLLMLPQSLVSQGRTRDPPAGKGEKYGWLRRDCEVSLVEVPHRADETMHPWHKRL
jgi:hypothetical protein